MGRDGGYHHEKLGLKRIPCASQFTLPDTAAGTPHPAGKINDTRTSVLNQASSTPDFSYPLVSSVLFPSSSYISLSLPLSQNTKLSYHSLSLPAMIMS
jgi:hypothetical protein